MSDTETRDQLVDQSLNVLCNAANFPRRAQPALLGQNMRPLAEAVADELIERGWRPPARVVTTVQELDALPVGSIVRDVERAALDEKWDDNMWAEVAYEYTFSSSMIHTPAIVLYEPEEGE